MDDDARYEVLRNDEDLVERRIVPDHGAGRSGGPDGCA